VNTNAAEDQTICAAMDSWLALPSAHLWRAARRFFFAAAPAAFVGCRRFEAFRLRPATFYSRIFTADKFVEPGLVGVGADEQSKIVLFEGIEPLVPRDFLQ